MNPVVVGKNDRFGSLTSQDVAELPQRTARRAASLLGLGVAILLSAQGLNAQNDAFRLTDLAAAYIPQVGPMCTGGVAADDGSIEQGYRIGASDVRLLQRLVPPTYPTTLSRVCACWLTGTDPSAMLFNFLIYDDDGENGSPGSFLGSVPSSINIGSPSTATFIGKDCTALALQFTSGGAYVGVQWDGVANEDLFACADESPATTLAQVYRSTDAGTTWQPLADSFTDNRAMMFRAEFTPETGPDPIPPAGAWLTTNSLPGFQFKARIDNNRIATQVNDCVPETLCLAGALPNRTEVFVRIIGPRQNGFLWPEVIRFTVSGVELWIQKTSGGPINYYNLGSVSQNSDVLNGLVDRQGFLP